MKKRVKVDKQKSAKQFRHHVKETKALNMAPPPMRGGYRL